MHIQEFTRIEERASQKGTCVPETQDLVDSATKSTEHSCVPVTKTEQKAEVEVTCIAETDSEEESIPATPQKKRIFKSVVFDDLESPHSSATHSCDTGMIQLISRSSQQHVTEYNT